MDSAKEKILIGKLDTIFKLLSDDDHKELSRNFKQWQSIRKSSIDAVDVLEKEIIDVKSKTDIARGVGIGAGILGGLSALIGFGLSLNESTKDTGENMMKGGAVVGALGGATSLAAVGANCYLSHKKFEDAKEILEQDSRLTKKLLPFLRKAEELDKLFQEVFGCSIASTTVNAIFSVFEYIQDICKEGKKQISEVLATVSKSISHSKPDDNCMKNIVQIVQNLAPESKRAVQELCQNDRVVSALIRILEIVKRTPLAIEVPRFFLSLKDCLPHIKNVQLFSSVMSLAKHSVYSLTFDGAFVVLTLIKLGIDVVALLSLKDDYGEKGTEYSKMLNEVSKLLTTELKYVTQIYESINKC